MSDIRLVTHEFDGRRADLDHAESVINDTNKGKWARQQAQRAKDSIMRQLGDKKLQRLRERLIRAAQAHDHIVEWKIGNQIREHMHQSLMIKPI